MMAQSGKTWVPKRKLNVAAPPFQASSHCHHQPLGYYYQHHGLINPVMQACVHHQPQWNPNTYAWQLYPYQQLGYNPWENIPMQQHSLGFNPWENIPMQQHCVGVGSMSFSRPQYYYGPPASGVVADQDLPIRILALRNNIIKQIEYYFSDENLKKDHYLIMLMDAEGWVPISIVADFKRVKRMCEDIPFILESLLMGSTSVEVQGDKIRRRDEWPKWIPTRSC